MKNRSILTNILILVLLTLFIPSVFGQQLACWAPTCIGACPSGTWDCTYQWSAMSWDTFYSLLGMFWSGYDPLICCMY